MQPYGCFIKKENVNWKLDELKHVGELLSDDDTVCFVEDMLFPSSNLINVNYKNNEADHFVGKVGFMQDEMVLKFVEVVITSKFHKYKISCYSVARMPSNLSLHFNHIFKQETSQFQFTAKHEK